MMTPQRFLIVAHLLALVHFANAMPPSPELLGRLERQECETPYYLAHRAELSERGVNQGRLIPYFDHLNGRPHLDESFNVLVILVDFSDNPASAAAGFFDNLLFGSTSGTMGHYFDEISYGNLDVVTVNLPSATGWRRAPQTYGYYVNGQNGFGSYPQNAQKLAEDAIALANPLVDFSQYDNDGDQYVDAMFIVHAGTGAEYSGNSGHIWSHAWVTNSAQAVDGVWAYHYTMEPEYWASAGDMTCGVYAHEMGHMVFGLPDLYDTGNDSYGLGKWSLMAGGSWNGSLGNSPAHPDAWSRIRMGFVTPTVVSSSSPGTSIPAVRSSATIFKLMSATGSTQQYVLVENRQQAGYDAALPGSGLLIYHVDDAVGGNTNQWYPGHTASGHYRVALEQADGLWQLEQEINQGNSADPYPGSGAVRNFTASSTPNSNDYAGAATGIAVQNISNSSATMTADLTGSGAASITLTYPNGGETWVEGASDSICWTSSNLTGNVVIELNRTYPTGSWVSLAASAPNSGKYLRSVPSGLTTSARIRVRSVNFGSVTDVSDANFTVSAGTIALTSPNGGETWVEGTTDTIRWTSNGFSDNIKIELNRTYPTGSWVTLVTSAPNTGWYPRSVPTGATTTARLRISRVTRADVNDVSNANFTVSAGTITVTSPNGGETWFEGATDTIRWTSSNVNENVKIELNRTYPTGSWVTLVASAPNTGSYLRSVPTGATTSARIRISRVSRADVNDVSNANFTISGGTLTLTEPNGGESWAEGTQDTFRWSSSNFSGNVKIELNRNYPSGSWVVLVASTANTGWYPRNVPTGATTTARVRISGATRADIFDLSDANFTIVGPTLTVTSPNGGETWVQGTMDTIRWTSTNLTDNVKIELNRSYPTGTWAVLVASAPNTGSYPRMVPTGLSSAARVRITGVTRTDVSDISNSNFTIVAAGAPPISDDALVPRETQLLQNSPNPFNPVTEIRFDMPQAGRAKLTVYDVTGREVADLIAGEVAAGRRSVWFDGSGLASGIYWYRLSVCNQMFVKKMILMK